MNNCERNMGYRILAKGVKVSNDTYETGNNNNDIIIGKSGSGKTRGYISYNLSNPNGSYIVSDTKGLLYHQFADSLREKGYEVKLIDFVHPEKSIAYNPLHYIRRNSDNTVYESDLAKLATVMVPIDSKEETYWSRAAQRYVSMLLGYVFENENFVDPDILDVIEAHKEYMARENDEFNIWVKKHPDSFTARKYVDVQSLEKADKTIACVLDRANQSLDCFSYKEFRSIFGKKDEVNLTSIGEKKTVIFVNCSDNDISFHIFSNIFNMQALQVLIEEADNNGGRLNVPTRIVFDDFAAGPMIENLDNVISIIRSREISVSLIIQSYTQLQSKYSATVANTIICNCDHIIYLAGNDYETAGFLSKYTNTTTRNLLNMPKNKNLIIEAGKNPEFVDRLDPYTGQQNMEDFS